MSKRELEWSEHLCRMVLTLRYSDYVFFFGYVQLGAKERAYSAANSDNARKLAEINGTYNDLRPDSWAVVIT